MTELALCIFIYLATGIAIWLVIDPVRYLDFMTKAYVHKHGTLPPRGIVVMSVVVAVVRWPKAVWVVMTALWDGMKTRWGRG